VLDKPQQGVGLLDSLGVVLGDFSDLIQKEIRLAKAELSENINIKLRSGVWGAATAIAAVFSLLFLLEGLVAAMASYGLPVYWGCLIVALVAGIAGGVFYAKCKADAEQDLAPETGLRNVKRDIKAIKEQLT
jgi:hypothetical protein